MLGSAVLTLAVGWSAIAPARGGCCWPARADAGRPGWCSRRRGLLAAGVVAFVGTLNPSSGDVSVFVPLEQAMLAHAGPDAERTGRFAAYNVVGRWRGVGACRSACWHRWAT
jgi:hypothetical protein